MESSHEYEHTQSGTFVRVLLGVLAVTTGAPAMVVLAEGGGGGSIPLAIIAVMAVFLLALFHSLTVRVSRDEIAISFGMGLIRKHFEIRQIQSAAAVRNRWYNGWGIRKIVNGWLFNVSGWDAVEIHLENGRRYRIGTDEPEELLAAIESVI
ncbi:MAG TPA: hypothetical protein EYN96_03830 [Candidatus Hydrogenedentes bacterium]|nr:hypothetical protein [Candidatus Hydrogenedentota bacterium]